MERVVRCLGRVGEVGPAAAVVPVAGRGREWVFVGSRLGRKDIVRVCSRFAVCWC